MLSPDEVTLLLETWNETACEYPSEHSIVHLIEAQVGQTPDAGAITWDGCTTSYRSLNEQANRLAHHLIALRSGGRGIGWYPP